MKLRDYQVAAVDSFFEYFESNTGNPIAGMPTGTGKSPVIGAFARRALDQYPGTRILKMTHVKELIVQNFDKLLKIWATAPAGIFSSGLGRREANFPITYAGVASVAQNLHLFGHIDLIIIDECHLVSPKDSSMYRTVINYLKKINPYLKVIGLTATMYRTGQGSLIEGEDRLFTDICIDLTTLECFNWFLDEGYLAPLIPKKTKNQYDLESVGIHAGEYVQRELSAAVDRESITRAVLEESLESAKGRNHWLVFASGIEHTEHVSKILNEYGITATHVHSDKKRMSESQRDQNIKDFLSGKVQAMVNNGILTTGFDFPALDCIVMLRPTNSTQLWVQMLGRGTRPDYLDGFDLETTGGRLDAIKASEKKDCLVLDFAGNTRRLGPINDPILPKRRGSGGSGVAPIKICEFCSTFNHSSVRFCTNCGSEFHTAVKFGAGASTAELIRKTKKEPPKQEIPQIEKFEVKQVTYSRHGKPGRPPILRVSYYCGLQRFEEWICLEHQGGLQNRARNWWQVRTLRKEAGVPQTTDEAILRMGELRTPKAVHVWVNKYKSSPEIKNYEY